MPGPMGDAVIPVEFSIPSDAYESNHDDPNDQVLWLLHAQAGRSRRELYGRF